jgi:hypothetical protein
MTNVRICQLEGCETELSGRQTKWCSHAHGKEDWQRRLLQRRRELGLTRRGTSPKNNYLDRCTHPACTGNHSVHRALPLCPAAHDRIRTTSFRYRLTTAGVLSDLRSAAKRRGNR